MTQQNATPKKGPQWPPWATAVLQRVAQSPNLSRAAEAGGVDRSTVYRLRDRDEAFAVALHDAREKALDLLEESIYAQAMVGLPHRKTVTRTDKDGTIVEITETEELVRSPTLAMFFLKRWRPEYRESFRFEQTGPDAPATKLENSETDYAVQEFYAALDALRDTAGAN
jgi:hypothetical protein